MSVYNNAPFVGEAIDSILRQSFLDFEFLIVNDGSTDGSGDIIDARAASDPRIRAIHQPNRGFIASLNTLANEACAPWIARMDGDDIALPDRFSRQIAAAQRDPRLGVIGCHCLLIDETGATIGQDDPKPLAHDEFVTALEDQPLMLHNAVLMRREPLLAVGGYHSAFRHAEDYDLWTRLIDQVRFANLPDRLVAYRVYPGQVSSRHLVEQISNAAIAWLAYCERAAGRVDPIADLEKTPPLEELDALFGNPEAAAYVRQRIVNRILYSPEALAGDGYRPVIEHASATGSDPRLWRASARLLKAGQPSKALGLARAMLRAGSAA